MAFEDAAAIDAFVDSEAAHLQMTVPDGAVIVGASSWILALRQAWGLIRFNLVGGIAP
jgi:hypothetical protein